MDKLLRQLLRFGVVGILCFGIDYGLMIFLTEIGKLEYLLSSGISFTVSVVVNYLLSMRFVFVVRKERNKAKEFTAFVVLSISGLILTELLMWVSVEKIGIYYMISKIGITGIVMIYNFTTRKIFLEGK